MELTQLTFIYINIKKPLTTFILNIKYKWPKAKASTTFYFSLKINRP